MKAAYLKAPRQFEVRDIELRPIAEDEVLVDVKACGFCGHDNILASYHATEWEPFGHEFSGVVVEMGSRVRGLEIGDKVCVETNMFDPLSDCARNGRPDLDTAPLGSSFMNLDAGHRGGMGFAEQVIVPGDLCVKFDGISFEEAAMIEPLGVAYDIVKTADIRLNDDVLVFGCGPIGLMAMKLARASGARRIYAAQHSGSRARCDLATRYGADEIIFTDKEALADHAYERGGVDRVLMTVPPKYMNEALSVMNAGGILSFAGISYNEPTVSFDSNKVHLDKLQIRGSNAIPALYFPMCIDMVKSGIVELKPLISHRMHIETLPQDLARYYAERDRAVKAVMVRE